MPSTPPEGFFHALMHDLPGPVPADDSALEAGAQIAVQSARQACEERIRSLIEALPGMVFTADASGGNTFTNAAYQQYTGLDAEMLLGHGWLEVLHPEDRERAAQNRDAGAEGGVVPPAEYRFRRHDGEYRWHLCKGTALRDSGGRITSWFGTCTDIEEYKRSKMENRTIHERLERAVLERTAQLRESEDKFRSVLESLPDAVLIADEDGGIVLANAQAERLFGHPRAALMGSPIETLIPPAARERHRQHRARYGEEPRVRRMGSGMVLEGLRKDGSTFPVEVSLSPIRTSHGSWVAATIRDISERKAAERQLVAERQRAEEASRSKSRFLAAMSHEIRTPMNAILGMSDLLWESDLDPDQRQYVEVFRRAGSNLLILIDDILDLSKIEAGHFELDRVDFVLEEVMDQAVELVEPRARRKGIGLITRIGPDVPEHLVGDPARLRQVLINLLGNAVKFTETGEILLMIAREGAGHPGNLRFSVSDTGVGIPPDKLEMIFDDFTQADSTTTRKYGGTGLGLAISRRIVERMGGRLTADSVPDNGSTFSFNAHFEIGEGQRTEREEVADLHGRRVLVVDDNPTNRLILHETLASWGLDSQEFGTAADAIVEIVIHRDSFALVVLDRNMPDMDGFDAAVRIRRTAPDLPVVMLTSEAAAGDGVRRRETGLAGYAVKPVKRAELFRLVCNAMRSTGPQPAEAPPVTACESREETQESLKILVAEDSPDNRLLVRAYLKGSPHQASYVEDGSAAVERFKVDSFDLVLMDIQMPVMDGLTAAREIRNLERAEGRVRTPVIALTAHAGPGDVEMSLEAGCDAHLAKPISKHKLLQAIAQYGSRGIEMDTIDIQMPEGLEELVPEYLAERRRELPELRSLLAASDFKQLTHLAHNMKGSGRSFGFPDVTRLGGVMEKAAKAGDAVIFEQCLAELTAYLRRVRIPEIA